MNHNAADFDEARWRRLADADAAEESLSDADREFLRCFTPRSADAKAEAQLFAAIQGLGQGKGQDSWQDEEAANSPLVDATIQHVLAARQRAAPVALGPASTTGRRRWTVAALAAVAVLVASWIGIRAGQPTSEETPASQVVSSVEAPVETLDGPSEVTVTPALLHADEQPEPVLAQVVLRSGTLVDAEGTTLAAEAALHGAVQVKSARACVGLGETSACMLRGARVEVDEAEPQHIEIIQGEGVIEASAFTTDAPMIVTIAGDHYTLSSPVTITTTAYGAKAARVEVTKGQVTLVDADGHDVVLQAGDVRGRSKHASVLPPPDAKTLLARARASRSAGDRTAAISHYEKLLHHHPELPASHAAMVSLGDLYLDTRKPAAALRWFQSYLDQGSGALAQEAYIGRIKALGALKRESERQRAIEAFRERYPSSRYADDFGGTPAP